MRCFSQNFGFFFFFGILTLNKHGRADTFLKTTTTTTKKNPQYYEPRGSDIAKAKQPIKKHVLEFFLFPMKPNFTTVVITVFTFDANRRA